MFRFLENLVDPYQPYVEQDVPPTRLWPFLKDYIRPFKAIFAVTALFSVGNAVLDVGMIWYLSRLVDLMTGQSPQAFLENHWGEILIAALVILIAYAWLLRPLGFPLATFGLIAALGMVLSGKPWKALVLAAFIAPGLWALFDQLLGLPLAFLGSWFPDGS